MLYLALPDFKSGNLWYGAGGPNVIFTVLAQDASAGSLLRSTDKIFILLSTASVLLPPGARETFLVLLCCRSTFLVSNIFLDGISMRLEMAIINKASQSENQHR